MKRDLWGCCIYFSSMIFMLMKLTVLSNIVLLTDFLITTVNWGWMFFRKRRWKVVRQMSWWLPIMPWRLHFALLNPVVRWVFSSSSLLNILCVLQVLLNHFHVFGVCLGVFGVCLGVFGVCLGVLGVCLGVLWFCIALPSMLTFSCSVYDSSAQISYAFGCPCAVV